MFGLRVIALSLAVVAVASLQPAAHFGEQSFLLAAAGTLRSRIAIIARSAAGANTQE
jgi:hypothetical protein